MFLYVYARDISSKSFIMSVVYRINKNHGHRKSWHGVNNRHENMSGGILEETRCFRLVAVFDPSWDDCV